jgi:hypothetical protein
MQYDLIFSTYINKTGKQLNQAELEADLVKVAKKFNLQGFSLTNQIGYWAGELEQSHVLSLLEVDKRTAFKISNHIKARYKQDAVILRPIKQINYFI